MNGEAKIRTVFFDLGDTLIGDGRTWLAGAPEVLAEFATRGIELGVISNTGNLSRDQLGELLPADFDFGAFQADLVLLSSELGFEKPDPRIFDEAVRRANVGAAACLFCTEDLSHTLAAQAAHLRAARIGGPGSELGDLIPALVTANFL